MKIIIFFDSVYIFVSKFSLPKINSQVFVPASFHFILFNTSTLKCIKTNSAVITVKFLFDFGKIVSILGVDCFVFIVPNIEIHTSKSKLCIYRYIAQMIDYCDYELFFQRVFNITTTFSTSKAFLFFNFDNLLLELF